MHVRDVGTHTKGEEAKEGNNMQRHMQICEGKGSFSTGNASGQLPFDAGEDERSGCETLCGFGEGVRACYVTRHVDGAVPVAGLVHVSVCR